MKKTRAASSQLPPIKGYMFDLDGTLLLSDRLLGTYHLLPGAIEVLTSLRERGIPYLVLTNGSSYPPPEQAAKLRGEGLPVDDSQMFTPSSIAAQLMTKAGVKRVLVLGRRGVGYALAEAGITVLFPGQEGATEVDAVYIGWHPDCTMYDIEAACQAIWQGAKLYVASDVPFFAAKGGRTMGFSYAIVGAVRRMTGASMILAGKPSAHAMRFVARKLGLRISEIAVVGDDPKVEIIMARRLGATAIGMTTGVMTTDDWAQQEGNFRPHAVVDHLTQLLPLVGIESKASRLSRDGVGSRPEA